MTPRFGLPGLRLALALACAWYALPDRAAEAQISEARFREILAQSRALEAQGFYVQNVGTVASSVLQGRSQVIEARGKAAVAYAEARNIDAYTAEQEMKNRVQWVNTFFERRQLNRDYMAVENPSHLDQEKKRIETQQSLIEKYYNSLGNTDYTPLLNKMMGDIMANVPESLFLSTDPRAIMNAPYNVQLSPDDIHHIQLSESGRPDARTINFRADSSEVLATQWPPIFNDPDFLQSRTEFESARADAITEFQRGFTPQSVLAEKRLMAAVDGLALAYGEKFPDGASGFNTQETLAYISGKRFVQTLAVKTAQLIENPNTSALDGSYRFQGNNTAELIHHMLRYNLKFAPPETGDQPTYRKLFFGLRFIHMNYCPKEAQPPAAEPKPPAANEQGLLNNPNIK